MKAERLFLRPTYIFSLISILLQTDGHDIQFLDEADLLADHIPILAAPGEVLAEGSRVALKCDLGEGYSVQISFAIPTEIDKLCIAKVTSPSPSQGSYHLHGCETTKGELSIEM